MVCNNHLDAVGLQESRHPSVMAAFGALVMELVPTDIELVPSSQRVFARLDDRDPGGPPPARVDLAVGLDWDADQHRSGPQA
jgi:hypothetical protein